MEYIDSHELTGLEDRNLKLRRTIAQKLARLHSMSVPIMRNQHEIKIQQMFNLWLSEELIEATYSGCLKSALEALGLTGNLLAGSLRAEADFVRDQLLNSGRTGQHAIVFSHRDLNHNNILVENGTGRIFFIDLDTSNYFYRGKN